ncbi:MAG: esterase-like activity of phytase family protein [Sphingomicrobium sp.]
MFQAFMLAGLIWTANLQLRRSPNRVELGFRSSSVNYAPVALNPADFAPLRLRGAWTLTSDDPRFGGISALVLDDDAFLAVTDLAVVARFARPGQARVPAWLDELPDGPRSSKRKYERDSEALLRDPHGRGWWVTFENRNEAWLYDPRFGRDFGRIDFGIAAWPLNAGIEAMADAGGEVLMFPESGKSVVRWDGKQAVRANIARPRGRISDAARLPGGDLVVLHRHWTLLGFANALTWLGPAPGGGYRTLRSFPLRGTWRDNFEALAAERTPAGTTRLWLMTDDNSQRPLRTLLIALDVPKDLAG